MYIGIDIGGTKCAVLSADEAGRVLQRIQFPTESCEVTLKRILDTAASLGRPKSIGISCGGPLDEQAGLILSPPNLPDWDRVPITSLLSERLGAPACLCNDANACALAEWRFGAGRGTKNMIFLTFGTGLGAGLILDGRLYRGTNGNAGEVGHVRLSPEGPVGYGKAGSFEGFCSGGGIRQLGLSRRDASLSAEEISAKTVAEAAYRDEPWAKEVFRHSAEKLGMGLSILVDLLNPEVIVLGSIYARATDLFYEEMTSVLRREALAPALEVCRILPAELGDAIGDYAAIAVAMGGLTNGEKGALT